MDKKSIVRAAAALLAFSSIGFAQGPPGITPEMIATALPVEGAPLAVAGRYTVTSEPAFGSAGHVVYRPADLSRFPSMDSLPVMVWGNGGCAVNSDSSRRPRRCSSGRTAISARTPIGT